MPNIMLVGFQFVVAGELTDHIIRIVKNLGVENDSVVTCLNSLVRTCSNNKPEPYLIVRCDNPENLDRVAAALNKAMGIRVEKELIQGFLPPLPGRVWDEIYVR